MPKRMFVRLPYATQTFDPVTTTSFFVQQFRANSIYDPDYTNTGHQPRGHDEYSNFFRHYRVHGVLVEVFGQVEPNKQAVFAIYPHKSTATPADIIGLMESPDVKYRMVTDDKSVYLKKYVSMTKVFGVRKSVYSSDVDYSADIGSNPTKEAYISVMMQCIDGTTSCGFNSRMKLTYYVELCDPLQLTQS